MDQIGELIQAARYLHQPVSSVRLKEILVYPTVTL